MRTQLLRDTERKISSINRQVTHAFFIGEQFLIDNSAILAEAPDGLTSVRYSANTYKNKFNYRLNQINDVYKEYRVFLLTSSFVFSNTLLLESLFLCLNSTMPANFNQKEIDTLDYIRWRRNCLVHAEGTLRKSLISLIKNKGKNLNTFWREILDVNSIDFSSTSVEKFHESEFIDITRILRYLTAEIDSKVLNLLSHNDIVSFALSEFINLFADKINNRTQSRLETMFSNFIQRKFDIQRKDLDFSKITF
jgi:hypothetical protein